MAACAVLVIIQVYHLKKRKIEDPKLSLTGLLSIIFALLMCLAALNLESNWYFGDKRWCTLSMKMLPATYSSHRILLYIFIILRVEVVNQSNIYIRSSILSAGKAVVGVCGLLMLVSAMIFTKGAPDEQSPCSFYFDGAVLITVYVLDTAICCTGTWLFLRPIRNMLDKIENRNFHHMLWKTKIWSIVSLVSTLVATFTLGVVDGTAGIIGFDCSITSFSLVMMMWPTRYKLESNSSSCLETKGSVELKESIHEKQFDEVLPSPKTKRSHTERLHMQIDAILSDSNSSLSFS